MVGWMIPCRIIPYLRNLILEVTGYAREDNFFVGNRAWTPFNSQNTALARRVLQAYFLSPHVGRFDDIFASFIVKRIADHLGEGVAFGRPLVRQTRNQHDAWEDLDLERMGCRLCDKFVDALALFPLAFRSSSCIPEEKRSTLQFHRI